jgi:hypothetical protein
LLRARNESLGAMIVPKGIKPPAATEELLEISSRSEECRKR